MYDAWRERERGGKARNKREFRRVKGEERSDQEKDEHVL